MTVIIKLLMKITSIIKIFILKENYFSSKALIT
jgi:hypothetical protein